MCVSIKRRDEQNKITSGEQAYICTPVLHFCLLEEVILMFYDGCITIREDKKMNESFQKMAEVDPSPPA